MTTINKALFLLIFFFSTVNHLGVFAQDIPDDLIGVGVSENLGVQVPLELTLINSENKSLPLSSIITGKRPVILNFAYYHCPMLCSLVLDALSEAVANSDKDLTKDYDIITLSIDPKETPTMAKQFQEKYHKSLTTEQGKHWQFHVASESTIQQLSDATGFKFKYLEKSGEYSHSAAIIFLTPEGKVSRYLYGINYSKLDFKLALLEATNRQFISTIDRSLLFCYSYDPEARSYVLHAVNIMKISGLITLIILLLSFLYLTRYDRSSKRK